MTGKKSNFIFGDFFGGYMSKVSLRTQYEGTMIGSSFILIFLLAMIVYWGFFTEMTWLWKVIYIGNAVCGIMILWSSVVTTFQQYQSFREIEEVTKIINPDKELKGGNW